MANNLFMYSIQHPDYTKGFLDAFVMDDAENYGKKDKLPVYIPKIMGYSIEVKDGIKEEDINIDKDICINDDDCKVEFSSSVKSVNYIEVEPLGFTNMKPPKFAKGEHLLIIFMEEDIKKPKYLYFDVDEKKRKTDILEFFVGGKENGDDEIEDPWYIRISTKDKIISIHTSDKNEEEVTYDFKIDANECFVELKDSEKNTISIKSKDKIITIINGNESKVVIDGDNITSECKGTFKIKADKIEMEASNAINMKSDIDVKIESTNYKNKAEVGIENECVNMKDKVQAMYKNSSPLSTFGGITVSPTFAIGKGSGENVNQGGAIWGPSSIITVDGAFNPAAAATPLISLLTTMSSLTTMPPAAAAAVTALSPLIISTKAII